VTGLIYIVIIALWAAVLIPMWLRRHDQISEVRSTARFEHAMHLLSADDGQRPAYRSTTGMWNKMMERAQPGPARTSTPASSSPSRGTGPVRSSGVNRSNQLTGSARRRAVVLATLTGLTALTLLAALASIVPMPLPILLALVTGAYMIASAVTAPARAAQRPARTPNPMRRPERSVQPQAAVPAAAVVDDWETWNAWDDEQDGWDAVPTTLPTYVTKPRASQVPRRIDRSRPGEWTGTAMVETAQAMMDAEMSAAADEAPLPAGYDDATAEIEIVHLDAPRRVVGQ